MATQIQSVDEYIAACPAEVQTILAEIRQAVGRAAPGSGETMSYQMPTVTVDGKALMYFAAWKKHIGIYPIPVLEEPLEGQVGPYRSGQDSVRFPLREPVPYPLLEEIVTVLVRRRREEEREAGRPAATRARTDDS